jgi:hypothetical protein
MGIAKADRFGTLRLGRRTVLRMMVFTIAGLMSLGAVTPAHADEPPASFWTQFTPSSDTRLIFVSNSEGHDANSGLTPAQPVKTLVKAESLLRDGFPDWMLLKRGDVWETGMPFWHKSGRSADERMVVGAYGSSDQRPQLRPGNGERAFLSQGSNGETRFVAFVGLHFEPRDRQGDERPGGITWFRRGGDILFEDLYVARFGDGFNLQSLGDVGLVTNIRINGCVIVESWSRTTHSNGIFVNKVDGLIIENSVIASNGFNLDRDAPPTIFNHNVYIQHGTKNVIVRNNIIADASSHGIQLRPGGLIEDNLFISNPLSILISMDEGVTSGEVENRVHRNVVMYGRDISPSTPRKFGIEVDSVRTGSVVDNILFGTTSGVNIRAIGVGDGMRRGMENITIERNSIVGWEGEITIGGPNDGPMYRGLRVVNNQVYRDFSAGDKPFSRLFAAGHPEVLISGNQYNFIGNSSRPFIVGTANTTMGSWAANIEGDAEFMAIDRIPDIGLESYLASLGRSGGVEEFLAAARGLSRMSTDPAISATAVYSWMKDRLPD